MKQLTENIKAILAIFIVISFFAYFFTIFIMTGKTSTEAIVSICSMAVGYYFGSSSSGSKKDETISAMAQNITPTELTLPEEPIKVDLTKNK